MLLILTKLQNDSIVIVLQKWKKSITLTPKFVFVFNYLNVSHRRKFFIELISSRYYGQLPLATVWPITEYLTSLKLLVVVATLQSYMTWLIAPLTLTNPLVGGFFL